MNDAVNILSKSYFNYVVSFSDGTLKTGITASPFYRLQDYVQEAHRHSIKVDGFEITSPVSKKDALKIEADFCYKYRGKSIEGHREWFKKDVSWAPKHVQIELLKNYSHKNDFICMCMDLNDLWEKQKYGNHKVMKYIRERKNRKINKAYQQVKDLASELGAKGNRIQAKLTSDIADQIIREAQH